MKKSKLLITALICAALVLGGAAIGYTVFKPKDSSVEASTAQVTDAEEDKSESETEEKAEDKSENTEDGESSSSDEKENEKAEDEAASSAEEDSDAVPAPDFTVSDVDGGEIKLSDLKGKPVVINIWSTQLDECKNELEYLNSLNGEYENRVNFMGINLLEDNKKDNLITVKTYLLEYGFNLPVYLDSYTEVKRLYKIDTVPTTIFIDKNGYIYKVYEGDVTEAMAKGAIEQMLK